MVSIPAAEAHYNAACDLLDAEAARWRELLDAGKEYLDNQEHDKLYKTAASALMPLASASLELSVLLKILCLRRKLHANPPQTYADLVEVLHRPDLASDPSGVA